MGYACSQGSARRKGGATALVPNQKEGSRHRQSTLDDDCGSWNKAQERDGSVGEHQQGNRGAWGAHQMRSWHGGDVRKPKAHDREARVCTGVGVGGGGKLARHRKEGESQWGGEQVRGGSKRWGPNEGDMGTMHQNSQELCVDGGPSHGGRGLPGLGWARSGTPVTPRTKHPALAPAPPESATA